MSKSPAVPGPLACCTPLAGRQLSRDEATSVANLLKALADPARIQLISAVLAADDGEACVCELQAGFDLSQPTISHHLKVLHEAGLLDRDKRGVWVYYRVRPEALSALGALFDNSVKGFKIGSRARR